MPRTRAVGDPAPFRIGLSPAYRIDDVGTESGSVSYSEDQDMLGSLLRHLLPTPAVSPPRATPIPSEREQLIQCLMGKPRAAVVAGAF